MKLIDKVNKSKVLKFIVTLAVVFIILTLFYIAGYMGAGLMYS